MIRTFLAAGLAACALLSPATAQEPGSSHPPSAVTITLKNGNTLQGTMKNMDDGKMVVEVDGLGDVPVPLEGVQNIVSSDTVRVVSKTHDARTAQITGLKDGALMLSDGTTIQVGDLEAFNPTAKPAVRWKGNVNAGAVLTEGNSNTRSVYVDAQISRTTETGRFSALFNWDYAEQKNPDTKSNELTSRRVYGEAQYDYFLGDCDYSYVNASALGNTLAGIEGRYQGGVGYGRTLFDRDTFNWQAEAGLSYVDENFRPTTPDNEYIAARVNYQLEWQITDSLVFQQEVTYLPSLETSDDVTGQMINRLNYDLGDGLVAGLSIVTDYDNTPASGQDRIDNRYALTVGWVF